MNEGHIKEEGLRDWFGKSKSKDGKKGWVNVVTGDSCASDKPGEGIPKCVSSAKRASMSKKERLAAAAAKRREDPGQQQKSGASKPTMVKTDRKTRKEEMEIKEGIRDRLRGAAKAVKKGVEQEKKFQRASGETLDRMKRMTRHKQDKYGPSTLKQRLKTGADHDIDAEKKAKMKEEVEIVEAKDKKGKGSGTKDACYHKVKSRYSVWPSAYASGALVKCRKVGAANWGNSSKKEEFEPTGISFQQFQEKCWKGYEKKGMKTMFGKRYPNCVKKEQVERDEYGDPMGGPKITDKQKKKNLAKNEPDKQHTTDTSEGMAYGITRGSGKPSGQMAAFGKKKKENTYSLKNKIKMVIKSVAEKERAKAGVTKEEVIVERQKDSDNQRLSQERGRSNYGKASVRNMRAFGKGGNAADPAERLVAIDARHKAHKEKRGVKTKGMKEELNIVEDDMKGMSVKSGHKRPTKSGAGMTQKGVEAYRRKNPGSKLKTAVTTEPSKLKKGSKAANRRKSYCARSAGQMKKFPKAAKDPNSRLRQARKRWNC